MEEFLTSYWQQLIALLAATVWLIRLESRVAGQTKELYRLEKIRAEDRASTDTKLDRLDDKLERNFAEFRSDIKILIRQGAAS